MKKMVLAFAATMMMTAAMAQENNAPARRDMPRMDRTEMLKQRTDNTVKQYGLNEEQAKKLLELNTKYADKLGGGMRGMGGMRPGGMRQGGERRMRPTDGNNEGQGRRPEITEEQRKEMNARREEREKAQKEYDAELEKIMTPEQFKAYKTDAEKRNERMRQGMGQGMPGMGQGAQRVRRDANQQQ
jgi:Spy/CpxP family protein refolding chaperone